MKPTLTFFAMLVGASVFAQLYVSPGSYVYSNDQFVYVKQDVNLANSGNLYLRNGSQLLQGVNGSSTNSGQGKLSVYQEGTVDNFEYNYWCSPVGNASAASGNESFGITMLNQPTGLITSNPASILPMNNTNGQSNPLAISQRWIYKFITSNNYSQWVAVNSATSLAAGEGFTMKGTAGTDGTTIQGVQNNPGANQRYDFRGKPNDGDIQISVAAGQSTLTGNPYPSAINLSQFLTNATNSTGIAYFWEQEKSLNTHVLVSYSGGYGAYAPVTMMGPGIYTPAVFYNYEVDGDLIPGSSGVGGNYTRYICPVGQGFLIKGSANGTVTMRNQYRVFQKEDPAFSQFERPSSFGSDVATTSQFMPDIPNVAGFDYTQVSSAPVPQIRFSAKIGNGIRTLVLGFDPAATDGPDHAMDAQSGDGNAIDMFFAMDSREYLISVIDFAIDKRIPLGLRNVNAPATFQITMNEMINFNGSQHVYVHDKLNDTYFEITNAVYEVTMPAGVNTDRFELTFTESSLGTAPVLGADSFVILQDNPKQELRISNPNHFEVKTVALYDLTGKLVLDRTNLGALGEYQFSTAGLSEAVYIVKVTTADNRDIGQKVSIFRTNN
ncbi:T9SS type A sorting domain-containing protein [Flavobacterium selenitireducens]|uniref:T9SS type A sorting domain-containing protein n=1 Tax=Flavobacterium selenitireducens TaxID=2722704 RepID=UPI00168A96BC|nr:T9SS type A sorting domain-containing protein [Flavobacterium selenitireducens]MBD3583381.1 T9SS type A sorting domain-containing protein [Flavobacterium selenitireducens]